MTRVAPLALLALPLLAQTPEARPEPPLTFDGGVSLVARQELYNRMPTYGGMAVMENLFRFREWIWGEARWRGDYALNIKFANEWQKFIAHRDQRSSYTWPDELVLAGLYFEAKNLFDDSLDLRVGRQDLMGFGSWRIFGDGTPGDGFRTFYTDALLATWRITPEHTLRLFGIVQEPENFLALGPPHGTKYPERQLNQREVAAEGSLESAVGLYHTTTLVDPAAPLDLYAIWKREEDYRYRNATRPGRSIWTQGVRFRPGLGQKIAAEIEAAFQTGRTDDGRDICAWMFYSQAKYTFPRAPFLPVQPWLGGGFFALSGDSDPNQGTVTDWNPLWGRHPYFSELLLWGQINYVNGMGNWCNLLYPSLQGGLSFRPDEGTEGVFQAAPGRMHFANAHRIFFHTGPLFTLVPNSELHANGGEGQYYGWLGVAQYNFMLVKNLFGSRGDLGGLIRGEFLVPGEYTGLEGEKPAYFLRLQLDFVY